MQLTITIISMTEAMIFIYNSCISFFFSKLIWQGTADELNWPRLNKNLFSVSSVMNGKKDAINEFEVINTFGAHYSD